MTHDDTGFRSLDGVRPRGLTEDGFISASRRREEANAELEDPASLDTLDAILIEAGEAGRREDALDLGQGGLSGELKLDYSLEAAAELTLEQYERALELGLIDTDH